MNVERLNGYLDAMATINGGADFGTSYTLKQIPAAGSPDDALDRYFNGGIWCENSLFPAHQVEKAVWSLGHHLVDPSYLREKLAEWFLGMRFSPKPYADLQAANVVSGFLDLLEEDGDCTVPYQIWSVQNSVFHRFYECMWDDLLIEQEGNYYLLHLGVSD